MPKVKVDRNGGYKIKSEGSRPEVSSIRKTKGVLVELGLTFSGAVKGLLGEGAQVSTLERACSLETRDFNCFKEPK